MPTVLLAAVKNRWMERIDLLKVSVSLNIGLTLTFGLILLLAVGASKSGQPQPFQAAREVPVSSLPTLMPTSTPTTPTPEVSSWATQPISRGRTWGGVTLSVAFDHPRQRLVDGEGEQSWENLKEAAEVLPCAKLHFSWEIKNPYPYPVLGLVGRENLDLLGLGKNIQLWTLEGGAGVRRLTLFEDGFLQWVVDIPAEGEVEVRYALRLLVEGRCQPLTSPAEANESFPERFKAFPGAPLWAPPPTTPNSSLLRFGRDHSLIVTAAGLALLVAAFIWLRSGENE